MKSYLTDFGSNKFHSLESHMQRLMLVTATVKFSLVIIYWKLLGTFNLDFE
jgi:hypothetical protein